MRRASNLASWKIEAWPYSVASVKLQVQFLEIYTPELTVLILVCVVSMLALAIGLSSEINNPLSLVSKAFLPVEGQNIWKALKVPDWVQACMVHTQWG